MGWHGSFPDRILLPHEKMILRQSPFFNANAFDPGAPRLAIENPDIIHWGQTLTLTGDGFADGDTVEFRDVVHSVRVVPQSVTSSELVVTVPTALGPGYIRVWRGGLRSSAVAFNVYP
jgi:hypothetical protein